MDARHTRAAASWTRRVCLLINLSENDLMPNQIYSDGISRDRQNYASASKKARASLRSTVSNPSVNQR
jgi:hypothetical protein